MALKPPTHFAGEAASVRICRLCSNRTVLLAFFFSYFVCLRVSFPFRPRDNSAVHLVKLEACVEEFTSLYSRYLSEARPEANNLYSVIDKVEFGTLYLLQHVARTSHPIGTNVTLIYAGGNTNCAVGHDYLNSGSVSRMFVYEPMPIFIPTLIQSFKEVPEGVNVSVLPYGLGRSNYRLLVEEQGKGTSLMMSPSNKGVKDPRHEVYANVKEVCAELNSIGLRGRVNVMYMNCEGCELENLDRLIVCGLIDSFEIIHFATHHIARVDVPHTICELRERLAKTHKYVFGVPYAQERWVRKV
jgi:hypothetical protein